jgi:hypothetical protein
VSRFAIAMTAITLGALAVGAAAVVGAFVVIDDRAAQVLTSEPRAVPAGHSSAATADANRARHRAGASRTPGSPGSTSGPGASSQAATVGSAAATPSETAHGTDSAEARRRIARHRHERRVARRPAQEPSANARAAVEPPLPAPQDGGRSASFFPFR